MRIPCAWQWGLIDKILVVGYSGNLGRAHDYATILDAAERLRHDPDFVFLMIGGGKAPFAELAAAVKRRRLGSALRFMPYQEQSMLRHSLSLPDLHWLSLDPRLEGLLLPSKFYGIAAAGKPMIFIGDQDSELAQAHWAIRLRTGHRARRCRDTGRRFATMVEGAWRRLQRWVRGPAPCSMRITPVGRASRTGASCSID